MNAGEPIFKRRPDRAWTRLAVGLLLALFVHGVFAVLVAVLAFVGWLTGPTGRMQAPENVALVSVPQATWDQNRNVGEKPPPATPKTAQNTPTTPKPPEVKPEKKPKGQVVDVAPGNEQKPPDDAKYLAEHDNKVEHETHAKDQTAFYKNAMPQHTTTLPPSQATGHDNVAKAQQRGNEGLADDAQAQKAGQAAGHFDVPTAEKRDKLAMLEDGKNGEVKNQAESQAVKGNSKRLRITPGEVGQDQDEAGSQGQKGEKNVANLLPSAATLDKITGAAPNDHLDQVDEGQGTYLNTREWKYASFFNRVKQSVGEHWDPSTPLRSRDPEGRIYAYKDRYTMLDVVLDPSGRIKRVIVDKSCGVDFLDQEAVAAFERSQPFPNPPPGLAENGEVRFTFGFFLEVNSSSSLRVFRARD